MRIMWYIFKPIVAFLMAILTRYKCYKPDTPFPPGPVIIVSNHLSWGDIPLIVINFPRRICFMSKQELFRFPWWNLLLRGMGSFPVHRGKFHRQSMRKAHEVLRKGLVLGVFPEGTRSITTQMLPAQPGIALIALRSGATLIPAAVSGTEVMDGNWRWLWRRPRVTIRFGKPFRLPPVDGKLDRAQLQVLSDFIMERIAELLPENYRGVYAENSKEGESGGDRESHRNGILLRS